MKLFIWEGDGVLTDYTNGMICALAPDLDTAMEAIRITDRIAMGSFPLAPTEIVDIGPSKVSPKAWVCWGGG